MDPRPVKPPTQVSTLPATGKVVIVNANGSVDVKHDLSRKTWVAVSLIPRGWTPARGDKVLVDHVNGHPSNPVVVAVLA